MPCICMLTMQVTYPLGARVGTSSMRRKAQILHSYPHLHVVPIRGNVNARLQLLETGTIDATVLALSGDTTHILHH